MGVTQGTVYLVLLHHDEDLLMFKEEEVYTEAQLALKCAKQEPEEDAKNNQNTAKKPRRWYVAIIQLYTIQYVYYGTLLNYIVQHTIYMHYHLSLLTLTCSTLSGR